MSTRVDQPSFGELVSVFLRIGLLSFGGPAGQIALMHRELVEQRHWIAEDDYLLGLNFCHLLPGPEAQQLATWIGWRLHGWQGGLAAGLLFVLPGALVIMILSMIYAAAARLDWFQALFLGIKAAVLAIVVQALLRIAGRALKTPFKIGLAVLAFAALFLFDLSFPLVVLGAGTMGMLVARVRPDWLGLRADLQPVTGGSARPWRATGLAVVIGAALWVLPLLVVALTLGRHHVLWDIGLFFSRLAVVTFGGAYAVLAYMAQAAVDTYGWLRPGEMADGLGLAETTPGPLIMVTQFVGYLAAFRQPAPFAPIIAGLLGAGMTLWVTFVPCFLWIFAFAPWIDRLRTSRVLSGGLAALTAAVVGVIANLALWFALHVLFRQAQEVHWGAMRLYALQDWDAGATLLAVLAALLVFVARWGVLPTLAICAAAGMAMAQLG